MNYSPLIFDNYSFQSKQTFYESHIYIFIYIFIWSEFSIWSLMTNHLNHLTLWVNIYVDVICDATAMLMFVRLIARIYNCQWHEWIYIFKCFFSIILPMKCK